MVSTPEKRPARQTLNDEPSQKINGTYLIFAFSTICFFFTLLKSPFACSKNKRHKNIFLHAGIFLALLLFTKKTKNIFWVSKSFENFHWISFLSKLWPCTQILKQVSIGKEPWLKGRGGKPTRGLADTTGRPAPGDRCPGPTFSNGFLAVLAGLSLLACCIWS